MFKMIDYNLEYFAGRIYGFHNITLSFLINEREYHTFVKLILEFK